YSNMLRYAFMEPAPHKHQRKIDLLAAARDAMETEARAILSASRRLNNSLVIAADLILSATGKLGHAKAIFTGIGKPGHLGGQLGRNLRVRVESVMHSGPEVAWATPSDSLKQVVIDMSVHSLGAACVVSPERNLLGIITDGDVRRALQAHDDIRTLTAADVM